MRAAVGESDVSLVLAAAVSGGDSVHRVRRGDTRGEGLTDLVVCERFD